MQEATKGDASFGKFNTKNSNLKKVLVLSLMVIICTMVLQPTIDAVAKKGGGGGGGGGKSGGSSSGNSHSGSNDKSSGVGSEHSNGKAKKNLDEPSAFTELAPGIEDIEESLTSDELEEPNHVPGTLLVKFQDGAGENIQNAIINAHGAKVKDGIKEINLKIITVPENAIDNIQSALSVLPIVEYVETDSIIEPENIPNDEDFPKQWHLSKINAPKGWDLTTGSGDATIAVIDTGFRLNHTDLVDRFVTGYNVLSNDSNVAGDEFCSHGTRVAGVVGPTTNNAIGVSGVTWANKIMPISVTPNAERCATSSSVLAKSIIYAADHGARVANLSWGIYEGDRAITSAAKYMYNHGGVVVAASGNNGQLKKSLDNKFIISVGATDRNDSVAEFSTRGKFVDFTAPGTSIYTTAVWIPYSSTAGTSFSAPIVSGLIGLMFSQNPNLTPSQVYDILKSSSVDLGSPGYDTSYGWGRIDVDKALQLVPPYNPPQSQ